MSKTLLKSVKRISTRIVNLSLATIIGFSSLVAATPLLFSGHAAALDSTLNVTYNPTALAYRNIVVKTADRLLALRNTDGGWDWILTNQAAPGNNSAHNMHGVVAQALLDAYQITHSTTYLTAAESVGDYFGTHNAQNGVDIAFLFNLGTISGDSTYTTLATTMLHNVADSQVWANDPYNGVTCDPTGCTATQLLTAYESFYPANDGIVAWGLTQYVEAAKLIGGHDQWASDLQQAIDGYLASPSYTNSVGDYALGLTAGVRADGLAGANSAVNLTMLMATQNATTGAFGDPSNGQVQVTSYALMALKTIGSSQAASAAAYLNSQFGYLTHSSPTYNGWQDTDGSEYAENDGEAAHALFSYIYQPSTYYTIQDAINAANSSDTINVASGTYTEAGQIIINKNLSIIGAGSGVTTVMTSNDTGSSGDSRGWFLVDAGMTFNISNLTLDGTAHKVYQAIRYNGSGTVNHVSFTNIAYEESGPQYNGGGVRIGSSSNVNVTNSTFNNMGRYGILAQGGTGTFSGNTYTGKGAGNWLDYAADIEYGANITFSNNQISHNRGIASSDGSTSAAIAVWDDPSTQITMTNNTLTDNTAGVAVAVASGSTDPVVNIGAGNTFNGNEVGVDIQSAGAYGSPTITINGSIFSGNITGIKVISGMTVSNMTAHNNIFTGNTTSIANSGIGSIDTTNNYWGSVHPTFASIIAGSVTNNPWYTDATKTILSNVPPVISLVDGSSIKIYQGTTYTDPGATATDNQGASVTVDVTNLPNSAVVGTYTVTYNAQDSFGNHATQATRSVEVLAKVVTQTPIAPTNTVSNTVPQIVIGANAPATSTITVPAGVKNASLNVSAISTTNVDGTKSATLGGAVNINSATSVGQVTVAMPVGLTITGPSGWDGTVNLPKVVTTTVTLPAAPGFTPSASSAIEVGFGDVPLTFDQPVRLVFVGQAGKTVGWSRSGVFSLITAVCTTDTASGMPSGANECKIDVNGGADLAVWTKHFTTFVTYSQTKAQTYTVVAGDTLSGIGVSVGVDWRSIASLNGINAPYTIYPGQVLKLPAGSIVAPAASTSAQGATTNVLGESSNPQIGTAISTVGKTAVIASTTKKANWFNWYWFTAGIVVALAVAMCYIYQAADKKPKS